jgi:hypothetical protein
LLVAAALVALRSWSRQFTKVFAMSFAITAEPVPLEKNADGVIRIGGTRVTLDTIVAVFEVGATPEEIVQRYPSLDMADVYVARASQFFNFVLRSTSLNEWQVEV